MSFWETKSLQEMSDEEWESLCDNCGKCCLHKLEDEDTGKIYFTSAVCNLINLETCRCSHYHNRCTLVPECIDLKRHDFTEYTWLPSTCAYRLLADGKPLLDWHPLISGSSESVHYAGISIRSYAMKEHEVDDLEDHIIHWQI
jgi:uncharacterized protein